MLDAYPAKSLQNSTYLAPSGSLIRSSAMPDRMARASWKFGATVARWAAANASRL